MKTTSNSSNNKQYITTYFPSFSSDVFDARQSYLNSEDENFKRENEFLKRDIKKLLDLYLPLLEKAGYFRRSTTELNDKFLHCTGRALGKKPLKFKKGCHVVSWKADAPIPNGISINAELLRNFLKELNSECSVTFIEGRRFLFWKADDEIEIRFV